MDDKIIIKCLEIYGYHGVNPEEKENGQRFIIDIELYTDISKPALTDNVDDTLSYSAVNKAINRLFNLHKFNLLEKCCDYLCRELFNEFPSLNKIDLTVKKPDAPMKGKFDFVGVKIIREREDY